MAFQNCTTMTVMVVITCPFLTIWDKLAKLLYYLLRALYIFHFSLTIGRYNPSFQHICVFFRVFQLFGYLFVLLERLATILGKNAGRSIRLWISRIQSLALPAYKLQQIMIFLSSRIKTSSCWFRPLFQIRLILILFSKILAHRTLQRQISSLLRNWSLRLKESCFLRNGCQRHIDELKKTSVF